MILLGSAARETRGNDYFEKMVSEAINWTREAKKKTEIDSKAEVQLKRLIARAVEYDGFTSKEIQEFVLIYKNLAPNDTNGPISIKMMQEFCAEMEEKYPKEYQKMRCYFRMDSEITDKKKEKLSNFVESFLNRFRTVENCYRYSKGFKETADRISQKLDAPDEIGTIEKVKWIRLWFFIIRDQNLFWNDIKPNRMINVTESDLFDREGYLTPDILIQLEKEFFSVIPDKAIILDMLKAFVNLYPKETQKDLIRFAELDRNEPDCLNPGHIRRELKKKIFPVMWISGTGYFLTKPGIEVSRKEFITLTIDAFKKGFKNLHTFEKEGTDTFSHFAKRKFKCYELGEVVVNGEQKIFAVTSENELKMYIEVYKWISAHPNFKFGADDNKKTLSEYGLDGFGDEQSIETSEWFKKITQNIRTPEGAKDMTVALKRIKTFGESSASNNDIMYLKYFKYMMKKDSRRLPKNVVNLYGKIFK